MKIRNIFSIKTGLLIGQLFIFSQFARGQSPATISFDSAHWIL
ncbi:MAG: hypothetical protein JWM28_3095 [Chitinophagaceae bacterium]|nr:hypothetical protein [Chitinophagaceae bacterium]